LAFERKVRKDLEMKGWLVSKWQNNIEEGECVQAKMGNLERIKMVFQILFVIEKRKHYMKLSLLK